MKNEYLELVEEAAMKKEVPGWGRSGLAPTDTE